MKKQIDLNDISIFIIGRNTAYVSLANILNTKFLYPSVKNIYYVDNESFDNTKDLFLQYKIPLINIRCNTDDINSFLMDEYVLYSIRHMLVIREVLQKCVTNYAIIMHADMFFLNNTFLFEMLSDLAENKVVSVEYFYTSSKELQQAQRLNNLKNKYENIVDKKRKTNCKYYLDHLEEYYYNSIWTGLTLIDLKFFKDNNYPFCDRMDERNRECVKDLFCDSFQDFQCFLVENNIPFKTYNLENNSNIIHFFNLSAQNTKKIEGSVAQTSLEANGIYSHKEHVEMIINKAIYKEALKKISNNTNISIRKILQEFSKEY